MIKQLIILAITSAFSVHCYAQSHLSQLTSKVEFDKLSGAPLANKYGSVKAVKVIYNLETERIYYISAEDYKNHYEFCNKELNYVDGYGNFLKINYSNHKKREYLLANINYFQSIDKYVLEISPTDVMSTNQITTMYEMIQSSSYINDQLHFITNSPRLQNTSGSLGQAVLTISPLEIYGNLSYQAISKYTNVGTLRFVNERELKHLKVDENDILVLASIPNYLPAVAGVIVTEFQTPLSHISILGLNRKIPICAYTDVFKTNKWSQFDGKQVRFSVKADTFHIVLDSSKIVKKEIKSVDLKMDCDVDLLIDIENLGADSYAFVGSKAANFAELYHLSKSANFKTPEGAFAIPFYFYMQHCGQANANRTIEKLLYTDADKYKKANRYLKKIRRKIEKTSIDEDLLLSVENKLSQDAEYKKFRFRSSTNAEDIAGFSGAGLYASKTGKVGSKKKSIEEAIKTVWASNWSNQAYYERAYYNIDQSQVAMGVLVHRSFPNEKVNGVAITKNIYRKNSNAFLVNAQLGNENVVAPTPGVICDQFLCFPESSNKIYKDKIVIDVITYSNLNNNELVMSEEEIQNLANQLNLIKKHYAGDIGKWEYTRLGYDVEFKIDGENRQLYIKQIRPYNE